MHGNVNPLSAGVGQHLHAAGTGAVTQGNDDGGNLCRMAAEHARRQGCIEANINAMVHPLSLAAQHSKDAQHPIIEAESHPAPAAPPAVAMLVSMAHAPAAAPGQGSPGNAARPPAPPLLAGSLLLTSNDPRPGAGAEVFIPPGTAQGDASLIRMQHVQDGVKGPPPPEIDPSLPPYGSTDVWRLDRTMRHLYQLQFPEVCNNARDVRDLLGPFAPHVGAESGIFGNQGEGINYGHSMSLGTELLDYRAPALALSSSMAATLVYPQPDMDWQAAAQRDCSPAWWSCWFVPSVGCEEFGGKGEYARRAAPRRALAAVPQAVQQARDMGADSALSLQCMVGKDWMTEMHCVDPAVNGADRSWWLMHIAMLTMQPNTVLLKHLIHTKAELGFRKPIVGMHLRGTDKHLEAERVALNIYTDLAIRMLKQVGTTRIFVATDDAAWSRDVVERALVLSARRLRFSGTIELVMASHERADGPTWDQALAVGITAFGRHAVTDTMLLAECDGWIGTKSSLFSEVSLLLGIGFHDRRMYVAADDPTFTYSWAPSTFTAHHEA